jgi:rubrerythrin
VIGQCWKAEAASDGVTQVFISPFISEPVDGLAVLVHELIHAALPEAKHGAEFKAAMKPLGLVGKATATAAGDELRAELDALAEALGDYDNSKLDPRATAADTPKTQKNRQLKVSCRRLTEHEDGAEYILRGARKTLERGVPDCPLCGHELELEEPEEDE